MHGGCDCSDLVTHQVRTLIYYIPLTLDLLVISCCFRQLYAAIAPAKPTVQID